MVWEWRIPFTSLSLLRYEVLSFYSKFFQPALLSALGPRKTVASGGAPGRSTSQGCEDPPLLLRGANAELKASSTTSSIRAMTSSGRCGYFLRLFDDSFPLFDCTMRMSATGLPRKIEFAVQLLERGVESA